MRMTWFACAALLIEAGGERLLFDPFVPLKGAQYGAAAPDYGSGSRIFITGADRAAVSGRARRQAVAGNRRGGLRSRKGKHKFAPAADGLSTVG